MKKQKYYVVTVCRSVGIDKYYRKDEDTARSIKKLNEELYPKATVELSEEEIAVKVKGD